MIHFVALHSALNSSKTFAMRRELVFEPFFFFLFLLSHSQSYHQSSLSQMGAETQIRMSVLLSRSQMW